MNPSQFSSLTPSSFRNLPSSKYTSLISILFYSPDLSLFGCQQCAKILSNVNYSRHLRESHKSIWDSLDKEALYKQIEALSITNTLPQIPPHAYYFDFLPIDFTCYKCSQCDEIAINRQDIVNHIRSHGSKNPASVLDQIPLQTLSGYNNGAKLRFIPILPQKPRQQPVTPLQTYQSYQSFTPSFSASSRSMPSRSASSSPISPILVEGINLFRFRGYLKNLSNFTPNTSPSYNQNLFLLDSMPDQPWTGCNTCFRPQGICQHWYIYAAATAPHRSPTFHTIDIPCENTVLKLFMISTISEPSFQGSAAENLMKSTFEIDDVDQFLQIAKNQHKFRGIEVAKFVYFVYLLLSLRDQGEIDIPGYPRNPPQNTSPFG